MLYFLRRHANEIVLLIRFDNPVVDVRLTSGHGWELTIRTVGEESNRIDNFDAVVAANGSIERNIDAIILCTGYANYFPFVAPLHPAITDDGIRALPLYQYLFHTQNPTLAFV